MKNKNNERINGKRKSKKQENPGAYEKAMDEFYNAHLIELLFEHGIPEALNKYKFHSEKKKLKANNKYK